MNMHADGTAAAYLEFMIHEFYNGLETLLNRKGLSDEELETVYALGYNFFTYGKYAAAKDVFLHLKTLAPYTAHYWRALGAVNQQLKDYDKAISAYDMAVKYDENDLVSYVYRGESQILAGKPENGIEDWKTVVKIGENQTAFTPWVQRAKLLLRLQET